MQGRERPDTCGHVPHCSARTNVCTTLRLLACANNEPDRIQSPLMMLMATGHLAMGRVWTSVNRLIAITIAHAPTICATAIISGLVVSSIDGIIGRVGHVHSLMDRQKPGFAVFPAADSHFSKATLRQNRAQSLAVATAAVTIAILPFFLSLSLFFFVLLPLSLSISLSLSCFPAPLSLYHESVSANRVKNDYARFMRSFVRRFVPRDLWATSMNDLRLCSTLGQLRLKNIGWLSLCDSLPGNGDIKFLGYLTFKSLDLRVSWHDNLVIT